MDNQHRKIQGYRELGETEIEWMNEVKDYGESLKVLLDTLAQRPDIDQRWLAIARTDLQKGIMALVRSIAKPTTF